MICQRYKEKPLDIKKNYCQPQSDLRSSCHPSDVTGITIPVKMCHIICSFVFWMLFGPFYVNLKNRQYSAQVCLRGPPGYNVVVPRWLITFFLSCAEMHCKKTLLFFEILLGEHHPDHNWYNDYSIHGNYNAWMKTNSNHRKVPLHAECSPSYDTSWIYVEKLTSLFHVPR